MLDLVALTRARNPRQLTNTRLILGEFGHHMPCAVCRRPIDAARSPRKIPIPSVIPLWATGPVLKTPHRKCWRREKVALTNFTNSIDCLGAPGRGVRWCCAVHSEK